MTTRTLHTLSIAAFIIAALSGCARKEVRPDMLLVTVDGRIGSCAIVNAPDAAVFTNAFTTAPSTLPAAASVLTGLLPPEHGLRVNGIGALNAETKTLATELTAAGYECSAFLGSAALAPMHGLTNGFTRYKLLVSSKQEFTVAAVANHLKTAAKGHPQFVWIHFSPYIVGMATNEIAIAEADARVVEQIAQLSELFPANAVRAIVPLFGIDPATPFQGFAVDDAATRVTVAVSGRGHGGVHGEPISIAAVKNLLLGVDAPSPPVYSEAILPWYVFQLSPLQMLRGSVGTLPPLGLSKVVPQIQATQAQIAAMRLAGHLGEGLIPAFAEAHGAEALDEAGRALVEQAAEAFSLVDTANVEAMQALVSAYPGVPVFHEWLGDLFWQMGNHTGACNAYAKASDLGINRIGAYRRQAKCHMFIGNLFAAIDKAENAYLLNPSDATCQRELAQLLLNAGVALLASQQYAAALECLNRVYWLEPKNAEAMVQLARLQLEIGQTNTAVNLLKDAMMIKPDHALAKRMLGDLPKVRK